MRKINKLEIKHNEQSEKVQNAYDNWMKERSNLFKIESELIGLQKKENSSINNQKLIMQDLKLMIKALNKRNYPKKCVCNHFGVNHHSKGWNIEVSDWQFKKDRLLVIFDIGKKWVGTNEVGCSKDCFDNLIKIIESEFKILKKWNGNEDCLSISMVINQKIPIKFLNALKIYDNRTDYNVHYEDFEPIFEKNLKELK